MLTEEELSKLQRVPTDTMFICGSHVFIYESKGTLRIVQYIIPTWTVKEAE